MRKIDGMTSISLNCNTERTNVILGHKTIVLWGQEYITDQIGDISYEISPVSFYQSIRCRRRSCTDWHWNMQICTGKRPCGICIAVSEQSPCSWLRKRNRCMAWRLFHRPSKMRSANAVKNCIENAEFFVGKSEEVLPEFYEKEAAAGRKAHADVIVVDPPRKGCD